MENKIESEYELKLSNGKIVEWVGTSGENAAMRYADCNKDITVIAFRPVTHGIFLYGGQNIIE